MADDPTRALPFPGATRETRIRRDRLGRWFDGEAPIEHPGLSRHFDRWIDRAEDGRYCLRNAINWAYVEVEGPPVFVRGVRVDGGRIVLALSDGRSEDLDPATLRQDAEGVLYCDVRDGRLPAAFDRTAAHGLEDHLVETVDGGVALRLAGGVEVVPPLVDDPLGER